MKKNHLNLISSFLLVFLFVTGCQKDHDTAKNECRLVFATNTDPTGSQDFRFHYNDKGLADEWDITNYGLFKQEYDASGKLIKSIHSVDGEVIFTIHFFYEGNKKVVKEILYYGTSTEIMDEVFYTYNPQGNMVKVQSFINDYVATAKYTPEGNLSASELFFGGIPAYSAFFKYNQHYKNPYLAVPGIDHGFPYYTPADLFHSKWRFASLKQVGYDTDGNATVLVDYDPSKTVWQDGPHNYPGSATYFDLLSESWFPNRFEFENCVRGRDNDPSNSQIVVPPTASGAEKIDPMMLLKRNPAKSMKEQVKDFRQQLKNFKN